MGLVFQPWVRHPQSKCDTITAVRGERFLILSTWIFPCMKILRCRRGGSLHPVLLPKLPLPWRCLLMVLLKLLLALSQPKCDFELICHLDQHHSPNLTGGLTFLTFSLHMCGRAFANSEALDEYRWCWTYHSVLSKHGESLAGMQTRSYAQWLQPDSLQPHWL